MTTDRIAAIEALLTETEEAHGAYESAELGGEYDAEWPSWYARYAVDHGMGDLLGRPIGADELGAFLSMAWAEFEAADPKPDVPWSSYIARRLLMDLAT